MKAPACCPEHAELAERCNAIAEEFAQRLAGLHPAARLAVCSRLSFLVMYEIAPDDATFDSFIRAMHRRLLESMHEKRRELARLGGTPS